MGWGLEEACQWVEPDFVAVTKEVHAEGQEGRPADAIREPSKNGDAPVRVGQMRAPRRWEQLLVEAAVIGSHDRRRRGFDGLANELRTRLAELSDEDETEAVVVTRTLDDLAALTAYALPLIDLLDGWPSSAAWGDWLDRLGNLATGTRTSRPGARDSRRAGTDRDGWAGFIERGR
jgi:hypothetical protein